MISAPNAASPATVFRLRDGALRGVGAELLLLPTGLITAAVLARVLGPADYGLFSLAASFIGWIGLTTTSFLSRAAVKFVSETEQWQPIATSILRWRLAIGGAATVIVLLGANVFAGMLGERALTPYLQVFAIDLLLVNLVRTYRDVLTGTGRFREVATLSVVRWIVRMVLLASLVASTRSVMAAVVGSVVTSLVELAVASRYQPLHRRGPAGLTASQLWSVAAPLLVFSSALQLHTKVDLFALSALGGTALEAGLYSAAQNLAVPPSLFALGFAPLLLATLGRLERTGQHDAASETARLSLRMCLSLIPLAAIVAGASSEIMPLIFGIAFDGAAPLLTLLFGAAVALAATAVCVSIVTASSRTTGVSRNVTLLGALLLVSAIVLHLILIPRMGATGAALATAVSASASAIVGLIMVQVTWRVQVYATAVRMLLAGMLVYWLSTAADTASWWMLSFKLVLLFIVTAVILLVLGEFTADDKQRFRDLINPNVVS